MNFVKSLKSTIQKRIIPIILAVSVSVLGNVAHASAATAVDQETLYPILRTQNTYTIYDATANTGNSIARSTNITEVLAKLANYSTLNEKNIYTKVNQIVGYVDGLETGLTNINTKLTNISTYVDGLEGYVDGVETSLTNINTNLTNIKGYVDGLEGYVDGLETAFSTNNTYLNNIKSAIDNITTYNYTSILTDIQSNMLHVPTIDQYVQSIQDSIGYGNSIDNVLTNLNSVNGHLGQIYSNMSYWDDSSASSTGIAESAYRTYKGLMRTISRGYSFVAGRGSNGTSNTPSSNNGIVNNSSSANIYVPFYTSSNNNSMQHVFMNMENMTITDFIYLLTNNVTEFGSRLFTPYTIYRLRENDFTDGGANEWFFSYSISDMLWGLQRQSSEFFSRLGFVLADDDTIAAKNANQAQEQAVLSSFTGSGTASASASDFGDIATGLTNVKSGINTNVSVTNALDVFDSSDGFGWFSNTTLNNLNTVQSTRNRKSANEYSYYNERLNAIYDAMGVKHD